MQNRKSCNTTLKNDATPRAADKKESNMVKDTLNSLEGRESATETNVSRTRLRVTADIEVDRPERFPSPLQQQSDTVRITGRAMQARTRTATGWHGGLLRGRL